MRSPGKHQRLPITRAKLRASLEQQVFSLRRYANFILRDRYRANDQVEAFVKKVLSGDIELDLGVALNIAILRALRQVLVPMAADYDPAREVYGLRTFVGINHNDIAKIVSLSTQEVDKLLSYAEVTIGRPQARILVIEDEPVIAADVAHLLREAGHSVLGTASTRSDAVRIAEQGSPDLVVADIQLSDGSSGIDAVRDVISTRKIPSVFLTAFPERLLTGERPEPTFLVTKPFQPETLVAAVAQALFLDGLNAPGDGKEAGEEARLRNALEVIRQSPSGATFEVADDAIQIASSLNLDDLEVSHSLTARALQSNVSTKAGALKPLTIRLSNQLGWSDLPGAIERLHRYAAQNSESVASEIGSIWSVSVEIASFLELDQRASSDPTSNVSPLPFEIRRPLEDLVRTAAPWVRMYPSARSLDDEAGAFLSRRNSFDAAAATIEIARADNVVRQEDAAILQGLVLAARRGEFQANKAQSRTVFSARNIVYTILYTLVTFELGAIGSAYSSHSVFADKAGLLLGKAESHITKLLQDTPGDVRWAYKFFNQQTTGYTQDVERWRETVQKTLEKLGGEASLGDIYNEIEKSIDRPLARTWRATVRRTLGDHSRDSRHFVKLHLFDKVGSGRWRLATPAISRAR